VIFFFLNVGIITQEETCQVIDRIKIRRERRKLWCDFQMNNKVDVPLESIYFDGCKDKTFIQQKQDNKYHQKTVEEEHVVLLQGPGSRYISHLSPTTGLLKKLLSPSSNFIFQ
jgi:hypothetical protein